MNFLIRNKGMAPVNIVASSSSRYKLENKPHPLEINDEVERYAASVVSDKKLKTDLISKIGYSLKNILQVGYNINYNIRETGEKTALEVFHDEGLTNKGSFRRFASCAEISYLSASIFRALDIPASCAVVTRAPTKNILSCLMPIKHMVVVLKQNGKEKFFDMTLNTEISDPYTRSFRAVDENLMLSFHYSDTARILALQGRLFTGLQFALKAIEISPQNGDSLLALGEIQSKMGDNLEAENSYLKAINAGFLIDDGPFNSLPHLRLGELFFETNRIADARYEFREAVRQYPAWYNMLIAYPEYCSLL